MNLPFSESTTMHRALQTNPRTMRRLANFMIIVAVGAFALGAVDAMRLAPTDGRFHELADDFIRSIFILMMGVHFHYVASASAVIRRSMGCEVGG